MWRKIVSIICGIILFFVLESLVFGIFARFRIGPVGNFITAMMEYSRDENNAEKFFEYQARSTEALSFMYYLVLPILSVFTGFLTAKISKTYGWICAVIAVGVPIIATIGLSKHMFFILPIIICLSLAAASGYITNKLALRAKKG